MKYRTLLQQIVMSTSASPSISSRSLGDLTVYLTGVDKKYNQLLQRDAEKHLKAGQDSLSLGLFSYSLYPFYLIS